MNIILPVIDNDKGKFTLAKGFHNTEYSCVFSTLNGSYRWVKTAELSKKQGNLSVALKRNGIYSVITSHMPYLALRLFKESGLMVYKSKGKRVEDNVALFLEEGLNTFTPQISYGASSGSACSSCNLSSNSCGSDCN